MLVKSYSKPDYTHILFLIIIYSQISEAEYATISNPQQRQALKVGYWLYFIESVQNISMVKICFKNFNRN